MAKKTLALLAALLMVLSLLTGCNKKPQNSGTDRASGRH